MTLTFELTEEESRKVQEARESGIDIEIIFRQLVSNLPQNAPKQRPKTGAELLAELKAEGLIGHPYGDSKMSSQEYARHLAETLWKHSNDAP